MAVLTYQNLTLQIIETKNVLREEILSDDQTTFLYLKWSIDVHCVYNPAATSFRQPQGQLSGSPIVQSGAFPPETDAAIRNLLMQPRGQLLYTDEDGRLILRSPDVNYAVDCKNGPIPQICEVIRIHGTKTWMVHFRIITYVNECPANVAKVVNSNGQGRNILLSHRWNKYVDVDQDYFSVVTTQGTATFRVDELVRQGAFPDQMRQQLFPAIPPNFRREHIQVRPSEDGSEVDYIVTDRELAFNGPNVVNGTRIECFQTGSMSEPNPLAVAQSAFISKGPALVGSVAQAAITRQPSKILEAAGMAMEAGAGLVVSLLPRYSMHIFCRVWGNRNSSRQQLMTLAFAVVTARFSKSGLNIFGIAVDVIVTQELTGKYVEVQYTVSWGPEKMALAAAGAVANLPNVISNVGAAIANVTQGVGAGIGAAIGVAFFGNADGFPGAAGNAGAAAADALGVLGQNAPVGGQLAPAPPAFSTNPSGISGLLSFFPANEDIFDGTAATPGPVIISQTIQTTSPPPNSRGSRGTWVGQLVAQALSSPCSLPPQPATADTPTIDINIYPKPGS